MLKESYIFSAPKRQTSCVIFGSPHSGRDYSESFLENSLLDSTQIRASEDAFVDELFSDAPEFGAPLLAACTPRAYVDLNRRADELDGALIDGVEKRNTNPRIASGLGVIPRVVAEGRAIRSGKLSLEQAKARLSEAYFPYHQMLKQALDQAHANFGQAILIDCHSMPHSATANMVVRGGGQPDIVLGDRFGASCAREITDQIEQIFVSQGFSVSRNVPFAGAYIVQNYGRPSLGRHAIQIEIDRSLYMDEQQVAKSDEYHAFKERLRAVVQQLAVLGEQSFALAAE
jgi:N-formylglutamate amidohydrolase